jgi:hypothetical protein
LLNLCTPKDLTQALCFPNIGKVVLLIGIGYYLYFAHDGFGIQCDTMGERMGRIGRIETDFFDFSRISSTRTQKKIRFNPPDPPHPFSHRITKAPNAKYTMENDINKVCYAT